MMNRILPRISDQTRREIQSISMTQRCVPGDPEKSAGGKEAREVEKAEEVRVKMGERESETETEREVWSGTTVDGCGQRSTRNGIAAGRGGGKSALLCAQGSEL
jgi:hypothetical protein